MLVRTATVVAIWLSACSIARAEANTYGLELVYKSGEGAIRDDWEKTLAQVKVERDRKVKAGELANSPRMEEEGMNFVKMLLYNKAVIRVLCAEEAAADALKNIDERAKAAGICTEAKLAETAKFIKLMDYSTTIGDQKLTGCEMKARDYKNELRFAPYEFLRASDGPKLFDFKFFNECILSDGKR